MSKSHPTIREAISKALVEELNAVKAEAGTADPVGEAPGGDGGADEEAARVFATVLDLDAFELSDEPLPDADEEIEVSFEEAAALVAQLLDGVMTRKGDCWAPISADDGTAIGLSPKELERANAAIAHLNGFEGTVQEIALPVSMRRIDAVSYVAVTTLTPKVALVGGIIRLLWWLLKLLRKIWKYLRGAKRSWRRIRRVRQMRRAGTVSKAVARALILKEVGRLLAVLEILAELAAGLKKAIDKLRKEGKNKEADAKQKELDKINEEIKKLKERLEKLQKDEGITDKEAEKAKEEAKKEDAGGKK